MRSASAAASTGTLIGERRSLRGDCGVLIVDDDPAFVALIEALLSDAGYACRTVASGEAALAAARDEPPRIVLLDLQMPQMSGYDLCRRLRERYGRSVGIVFISGARTESHDKVAGLELGGDDFVSKPFDPGELVARVRSLARRLEPADAAAAAREQPEHSLSAREAEVLGLVAEGLPQKQVAQTLSISRKTVGSHMSHIFEKLGVHSQGQAVAAAQRLHLLERRTPSRALHSRASPRSTAVATAALLGLPAADLCEIFQPL
jgi:DNA-binding NarL/FixJ family response regulator